MRYQRKSLHPVWLFPVECWSFLSQGWFGLEDSQQSPWSREWFNSPWSLPHHSNFCDQHGQTLSRCGCRSDYHQSRHFHWKIHLITHLKSMLPLSIRKFTILLPSKILRLLNHTGSLPLIMLQPCSSASGRIWEAIFGMLRASSSRMVFHSIHLHVAWISAVEYKTRLPEEYTHRTLWVGVLLGINLLQGNIQYIKSFGI